MLLKASVRPTILGAASAELMIYVEEGRYVTYVTYVTILPDKGLDLLFPLSVLPPPNFPAKKNTGKAREGRQPLTRTLPRQLTWG